MVTRKPLTQAQLQRREQTTFTRRIRTMFTNAGFVYLPTNGIERTFGNKVGELDQVFVFENIVLVCEDTVEKSPRDHLKNKKILADEIAANTADLIAWLTTDFGDRLGVFDDYDVSRYKVFFLYFSKNEIELDEADVDLFKPVTVVAPATLSYFVKMTQNIKRSARTDIFRFLGISSADLGLPNAADGAKKIPTSIIYPVDNTGFRNGVRVVSFMMSADMLLRNSYVLRKDNWQDTIELYQRLIERDRILKIRKFLTERKSTFINNIIVSLPSAVEFRNDKGHVVQLNDVSNFDGHTMLIPDEMNSICVIDGQHRIFAHYEGLDQLEPQVAKLRKKFHLLVTGLIFPDDMTDLERRKFESELFLDINSNAKPVPQDVLLFIETLKDPFSDLGVARQVLTKLNDRAPFRNLFQMSLMDDGKIKIASIIKFALRYLVDIVDAPDRLFHYWGTEEDREELLKQKGKKASRAQLEQFVDFAAGVLSTYFSAVKATNSTAWDEAETKIRSTTAINGYVIALRRSLEGHGVLDFAGYKKLLGSVDVNFSKSDFPYASSQYAKFSRQILAEAFGVDDVAEEEPALPPGEIPVTP